MAVSGLASATYSGPLGNWFTTGTPTVVTSTDPSIPNVIFTPIANGAAANVNGEVPTGAVAFPGSLTLAINVSPLTGLYSFDISGLTTTTLTLGATHALQYYLDIDGWFAPDQAYRLGLVRAGMNVTDQGVYSFTKSVVGVTPDAGQNPEDPNDPSPNTWDVFGAIFDQSLTTVGGGAATINCGECTRFLVTDYIVVPGSVGTADLSSLTNTYGLVAIPEPATLALFGTGLALVGGAGVLRRRKKTEA